MWERDALNASDWLKLTTTKADVSPVDDRGVSDPTGLSTECQVVKVSLSVCHSGVDSITVPDSLVESSVKVILTVPSLVTTVPSPSDHTLGSPCPPIGVSSSPPGYREPKEDETSLNAVLDSLLPFIRDQNSTVQLPVYLGKSVLDPATCDGEANSSCPHAEGAWEGVRLV
jgi:hypothetical protein